jgi:hypothetical protein
MRVNGHLRWKISLKAILGLALVEIIRMPKKTAFSATVKLSRNMALIRVFNDINASPVVEFLMVGID